MYNNNNEDDRYQDNNNNGDDQYIDEGVEEEEYNDDGYGEDEEGDTIGENYTSNETNSIPIDDELYYLTQQLSLIDKQTLSQLARRKDGSEYDSLDQLIEDVSNDTYHLLSISNTIDDQLKELPATVVNTYLEQTKSLVELHNIIQENDDILEEIEDIFQVFDQELHDLVKDMPDTHVTTLLMSKSLENRIQTRDAVSTLVKRIVIPPDLISSITSDDINEEYVQNIQLLTKRIDNLEDLMSVKAKFGEDIAFEIDLLKKKACRSVRDFLLKLIIGLRKPRTNIQILQHSKLFKYSALNQFLYNNAPSFAMEIKNLYLETVSRIFTSYFKSYINSLQSINFQIATKSDVIGYYDTTVKGYFGTTSKPAIDKNKKSAFNLNIPGLPNDIWTSIRSEIIDDIPEMVNQNMLRRSHILIRATDAPLIVPHTAIKNGKRYPFEQIFRSMNILFLDTVCSEYLFDQQWFAKKMVSNHETSGIIKPMFDKIFKMFYENMQQFVSSSYDCLGVLLSIKLNQKFINILQERKLDIPCLSTYFHQIDVILWDKFSELFKRNIDSLKLALTKDEVVELRPHIYTRRFSEFYASISEIIGFENAVDSRVSAWMAVLRSSMERLLEHFSNQFQQVKKQKSMFLINNYDVILTVLRENNLSSQEDGFARFKTLLDEQTNVYVEEQLLSFYKSFIDFIKDTEYNLTNQPQYIIDKDKFNHILTEFSQKWRDDLQKVQLEVMTVYSNFNLGSDISKKIISQFLIYYKRLEEIYKKALKQGDINSPINQSIKTLFVPIPTITYEISKRYS